MNIFATQDLRNVALIGHGDAGKTTFASAALFNAGAVPRLGSVDDGTAITDFDDDEKARKVSINASLCFCEWKKHRINFLDTPGYGNFILESKAALRVADSAAVFVCAVAGVEVQTSKVWGFCEEFELPRMIVINKMDRERASFQRALDSIQSSFGRQAVPIQIPVGSEKDFEGIIDLVAMKAYLTADGKPGTSRESEIPDDLKDEAQSQHDALVEMVAEMDDSLLEKFFEEGTLSDDEFERGLKKAIAARKVYPVVCASALENIAVDRLLQYIVDYMPSPADREAARALGAEDAEVLIEPAADAPYSAYVFKTIADPYAGKISLFRVYSGVLNADSNIHNVTKDSNERLGSLFLLQGKEQTPIKELRAGDIGAVAKLKDTSTGDSFADKSRKVRFATVDYPQPAISFAIEPKARGDEEKISSSMARLTEEDPTLHYDRDPQTGELLVSGMGQLHVEVTIGKLKRKFGVDVILHPPKVPYRETITGKAEVQGRYKKQTGGRGQFGDCHIRMEPLERGKDFEFANEIFGGSIPRQFIPAVEKGILESRKKGILAGHPVVDFKVTLFDGSYHTVDSSEMAFKIAGSMAFKKGMEQSKPALLEPIMNVEVVSPDDAQGDVVGDLNSRRGRVLGMDPGTGVTIVKATVPMAEMLSYLPDLNSMTGGRGSYTMEFSHYDFLPAHLVEKIVAETKQEKEESDS